MHNSSGLQAADCYAGMLKAAIVPDQFGYYESSYFLQVAHQVWRSNTGCALGNGFKVMAPFGVIQALPWWAQSGF
jgi:hypothetical protein